MRNKCWIGVLAAAWLCGALACDVSVDAALEGADPSNTDPNHTNNNAPHGSDGVGSDSQGNGPHGSDPLGSDPLGSDPHGSDPVDSDSSVPDGSPQLVYALNAGGSEVVADGITYHADAFFDGGTPHTVAPNISGAFHQDLFQSERYGTFRYEIPVTDATYDVNLHFAELYQSAANARLFHVDVEGESLLYNKDLFADVGAFTAYTVSLSDIAVSDGRLTIDLESVADNATICGFDIWSRTGGKFVAPAPPEPPEPGTATDEDSGMDCVVGSPRNANGGTSSVLPDPFTAWSGDAITTKEGWRCRRREILTELENKILGPKAPPPESVTGSITNSTYEVTVTNEGATTSFSGSVSLPRTGSAPYPAIIMLSASASLNAEVLSSEGIATISYNPYDIASEAARDFTTGKYYTVNPSYRNKTGALMAWAWGVSRIIDMLERNPNIIDPSKIAAHGCSRFGKGAFVAGAFDERIALGLPFEPGTGGPAPLRALLTLDVEGQPLSNANGEASWFAQVSSQFDENTVAVDMNDVAVLYAPRGLLLMDNAHVDWLSYKANYLGMAAARKVYVAMGRGDALWYAGNTSNGSHCVTRTEYAEPLRAMIKKFLKGDATPTTGGLNAHSNHGNINVDAWTQGWKTITLQ